MSLEENIIDSVKEIYSSMLMIDTTVQGQETREPIALTDSITGVIGLAGTHKGVLAIHLPGNVAKAITGNFLGIEVEEINEDVEDAIGELANMLGGNVKSILSEKGRDIDLSMPSTISGKKYEFQSSMETDRVAICFNCSYGNFAVELQIEK